VFIGETAVPTDNEPLAADDTRPDWQRVIARLQACGMTQGAIASQIGVSQGAVSHLATGRTKDIDWTKGDALLKLLRDCEQRSAPSPEQAAA
jgi:predicted transcriptional regulator